MKGEPRLIEGEVDTNIESTLTMQVINALQRASKSFNCVSTSAVTVQR